MERSPTNMQDIRNSLGIKSLQTKIERRSLQRIGHFLRMDKHRPVKRVICGSLPEIEHISKQRTKIRTTPYYWLKLVKEAGIDPTTLDVLTANRNTWKEIVRNRNDHLTKWEASPGNRNKEYTQDTPRRDLTCPECEKISKTAGGLSIHIKPMHRQATISFNCGKCQTEFKSKNTLKNYQKRCQGERKVGSSTQCRKCGQIIQSSNFERHRKKCCPSAPEAPQSRIYKVRYVPCPHCEYPVAVTNLARHLRACRATREESTPSTRG